VLGDPGAGKTTLLIRLVLDLLARRQPGGPVPVLVPLAGWNPVDQDLLSWLADRLIVDHPALAEPAHPGARGVNRARALWDQRRLLPILDGLDELPEGARSRAITRLNDALAPRQGLVLASRVAAYRQAATPADPAANGPVRVWGAAGISLHPLAPDDVRAYLRRDAASPAAAARWDPVLAALGTSAPVAQALTTPLLVGLARVIYNPRPGEHTGVLPDPAELCERTQLPTLAAIQEHLFDGFIPAAYRPHPDPASRCSWTAKRAERWLVFLAQHLERDRGGTTDLAWWELYRTIPRDLVAVVVALVFWLGVGLGVGLGVELVLGLLVGPVVGLGAGLAAGLLVGRSPARGIRWAPTKPVAVVGGLLFGLLVGLPVGFVVAPADGLLFGLVVGLVVGLAVGLGSLPADLTVAAEPQAVLARDRRTFWILTLVGGLVFGLLFELGGDILVWRVADLMSKLGGGIVADDTLLVFRLVVGLVVGLVGGLALSIGQTAWVPFLVARCSQALRRHLPWRLMSFLADAHQKRGVLRQAGAVYQFRHVDLQVSHTSTGVPSVSKAVLTSTNTGTPGERCSARTSSGNGIRAVTSSVKRWRRCPSSSRRA
jgi:hypothetical protein